MMPTAKQQKPGWHANLLLAYEQRGHRTVLAERRHDGPLLVQKPLYPEGDKVCHTIVVHPPGGIVGGDELTLAAHLGRQTHVLATTPGATKWYRSDGTPAHQHITWDLAQGALVEWLPQETIVFDGALMNTITEILLSGDSRFFGWEFLCLGRAGAGEKFIQGECRTRFMIKRDGIPLWFEQARLPGASGIIESPVIMAKQSVVGTLVAASSRLNDALLHAARELKPLAGCAGVTLLPGLMIGRYLGSHIEAGKNYFIQLWRLLRPTLAGRAVVEPRIWRT